MQQTSFGFDRHLRAQIGALQGRFKSGTEPGTIKMAMASECTSPPPSDGVTEEKEGTGLFSKIVNCVVELCYEPAKELCVSVPYVRTYVCACRCYCVDCILERH